MALLLWAPAALAGPSSPWAPVTPDFGQNFNLIGLHRTVDGVLHVAAQEADPANAQRGAFVHIPISPDGTVGASTVISGNWVGTNSPDITANPGGGLLAIWGGIHSLTTGDPQNNGTFATSDDSGTAWTVDPVGPWPTGGTVGHGFVYAAQIGAANGSDGTPFETWSHDGAFVHRGLDPNTPATDFNAPIGGDTVAIPAFGLDGASGALWLGWQNNLKAPGVRAQEVDQATGAPLGSPLLMPGSVTNFQGGDESIGILGRTPITGRPGKPGVWMAYTSGYPTATKVLVWKVGDATSTTLVDTKGAGIRRVAIAADPEGRIIVAWGEDTGGIGKLFMRVSTPDVSTWGSAFEIDQPSGFQTAWALQASAQSGAFVDLLQNYTEADGKTVRFWHRNALAPPVLAKAVNARIIQGTVLVRQPGSKTFVRLTHDSQIPVGATVDATKGRVRIVTALPGGATQSADFYRGVFVVTQSKTGLATLALAGGNFKRCGKAKRAAATAAKALEIRKLWGNGKGKFRTKGRYATAAIRGTTWLTSDRCDGTLIRVTAGSVTVRDLVKKKDVVVSKGQSYLAKR